MSFKVVVQGPPPHPYCHPAPWVQHVTYYWGYLTSRYTIYILTHLLSYRVQPILRCNCNFGWLVWVDGHLLLSLFCPNFCLLRPQYNIQGCIQNYFWLIKCNFFMVYVQDYIFVIIYTVRQPNLHKLVNKQAQPIVRLHSSVICHMNENFVGFQNMCNFKRSDY